MVYDCLGAVARKVSATLSKFNFIQHQPLPYGPAGEMR
jgi:hypothetical protein